ncbi:hypothetical protein [Paenibacillus eucommiae]|uniref:Uncharacterized protein n=1 Tax=Paenibacillus eucommiae TaxID=1355755 RepID=A0ABS4J9J6_9BACL|nr:hypothetical protein [Paenibacillus eucommiae]MBP1996513.1 hypothetical protein [Paenibacillus eucommiae]
MLRLISSIIFRLLFYRFPQLAYSQEEIEEYEKMYSKALTSKSEIKYSSNFPKLHFIQYIASTKKVVLHGSNHKGINEFEPRRQTLFNGKYEEAVFATRDGIWPIFYAVFDRNKLVGNFRNACISSDLKYNYYFFSLTRETILSNPWTSGMLYFLPEETFEKVNHSLVPFDEWISKSPVAPLTKIEVEPEDFYFINKVSYHNPKESVIVSWFLYKLRTKFFIKR